MFLKKPSGTGGSELVNLLLCSRIRVEMRQGHERYYAVCADVPTHGSQATVELAVENTKEAAQKRLAAIEAAMHEAGAKVLTL